MHVIYNAYLKSDISSHSKAYSSHSVNLQALDWVDCEEETNAYYQLSLYTYKFVIVFLKLFILQKKFALFRKFHKIHYSFFFSKRDNWEYIYMY